MHASIEMPLFKRVYATPESRSEFEAVPAGEVTTYGATPLDRMETLAQQSLAKKEFLKLTYKVDEKVPLEIAAEVHESFGHRFDNRGEANDENFVTSLMYDRQDELAPEINAMVEKAKKGHASPAELLLVREAMGIRSVELACLTHPYGTNIEILDDMRAAVDLAILATGGKVFDDQSERYAVKEAMGGSPDTFDTRLGFLMTRKRKIGILPDGTEVRERSSFIIRTDEKSYLPDTIKSALAAIAPDDPDWKEKATANEELRTYVKQLLAGNHFAYAIPISSTAYAYNEKTAAQVAQHVIDREVERQKAFAQLTVGMTGFGIGDLEDEVALAMHNQTEAEILQHRKFAEKAFQQAMPIIMHGQLKRLKDLD